MVDARVAMDARDFARAIARLHDVLASDADNLEAHYRLGVSASYLGRSDDATREFEWVVAHGRDGSVEVRTARDWLAELDAGPAASAAEPAGDTAHGRVRGRVTWRLGVAEVPLARHALFLEGVADTPSADASYVVRTRPDGSYDFADVVPGPYTLTDRIAGEPRWRLEVTVPAGEDVRLDLGPDNAGAAPAGQGATG